MKIVILDGFTTNPGDLSWEPISALGELTAYERTSRTDCDLIRQRLADADVAITNKTPITEATVKACPKLRLVTVFATGYNNVDTEAAAERGVTVCNVPGYSRPSVAQHAIALLLEATNHVGSHSELVHKGVWTRENEFWYWPDPLMELSGKTLGIIGFGDIGGAVAKIAVALGMKVLAYSRHPDYSRETELIRYAPLDALLAASDAITLHCPLTPDTKGLINAGSIGKMKDGVIVINTARGPVVDERAMVGAVESGKVAFYCADVVETEPISPDSPLLGVKNVILTPHLAWAFKESRERLIDATAANIRAWQAGSPINKVN